MDMHIPHALLQIAQEPGPYRVANRPDYFFSEQLSASYEAAQHALWIRWTPSPRPSFNPEVLRSLDRCAQFIRAGDGFIRAGDELAREAEDTADRQVPPMPIEYTVLSSGVPGVFNLGGDLDLFLRLIEARDRAGLVEYGTACIHVLYQNYCAHELPITTISLVQGDCLGGGFEAALSSDVVIAEKHVRFGFPEIMFNLFPGMGAYSFLDRRVGRRITEELLSTGKTYSADDMLAMGVIDRVADSGQGEAEVGALIRRQSRNRNGLLGIASVRRRVNPVTFQELLEVVHLWADCALRLSSRDLKLMQRLVSRQNDIASGSVVH
jgi:DSF synthase